MDHLEKFIRENRKEFDVHLPSDQVWNRIEHGIHNPASKKGKSRIITMRWVSAIAASVILAMFAWNFFESNSGVDAKLTNVDPFIEEIDPGFAQQVRFVNLQIQEKQAELRALVKNDPEIGENLLKNLEHLNASYDALRINLEENINQEVLLQAMIENLNLQLTILNQQLNLIQQIKNENSNEINI